MAASGYRFAWSTPCRAAPDAKSALGVLQTMKPDVLVSDISMPDHDGFWPLKEGRSRGFWVGVPTLVVTAMPLPPTVIG